MAALPRIRNEKPRELRYRVVLPARMRAGCAWSDACILNVSSRGLLIRASRPVVQGSTIELWRGERVIVARVVWREGLKAGLSAEDPLPLEEIATLGRSPALQLTAARAGRERRQRPRTHEDSRLLSRAIEFVSIAVIASCFAGTVFAMVEAALTKPIAIVEQALGG
jgi:hypothetical protein